MDSLAKKGKEGNRLVGMGQGSVFSVFKIRRPAGLLVRRADEILNTGDEVVSFRDLLGLSFP